MSKYRTNTDRVRILKRGTIRQGAVVCWMNRDQRVRDNWALVHAQDIAREIGAPLAVVFCLVPSFLGATIRHYGFMLRGLEQVEQDLRSLDIPFFLLQGDPVEALSKFVRRQQIATLVTDFDPLKVKVGWKKRLSRMLTIPFFEVDAHNIVPCWVASSKQEYGAYTLRPKLKKLLPVFLDAIPQVTAHPYFWKGRSPLIDWRKVLAGLQVDRSVAEVDWIVPGESAAKKALVSFIDKKLSVYSDVRNDPTQDGQSNLSPYLHFGQLAAQRVALEVIKSSSPAESQEAFLEELITRRELSDNFCFYNPNYDKTKGFPAWATKTLAKHRNDHREYHYSLREFEQGLTHDDLWNAAQHEMQHRGKMHGYLRMYWAKKILEWSKTPESAMKTAIYLNDRYELDGRDPNGYAGIAWSIGGVHDRPWGERKIFGMVRFMSDKGCRTKFDVEEYIERIRTML
jgi:deoxyribodipyrimidine photo-lyase